MRLLSREEACNDRRDPIEKGQRPRVACKPSRGDLSAAPRGGALQFTLTVRIVNGRLLPKGAKHSLEAVALERARHTLVLVAVELSLQIAIQERPESPEAHEDAVP